MPIVRRAEHRRTETPNAVMTTLASPTLGGSAYALWRVDMQPGQAGPLHTFDQEQIWTVVRGRATVDLADETIAIEDGDTLVVPARLLRRFKADSDTSLSAIVTAHGEARASLADGTDRGVPDWIA